MGERFQVKQPGTYSLIRVPLDKSEPALLEVVARIKPDESAPCRLYIKGIMVLGRWLGHNLVEVFPLQRDKPGSNTAGSTSRTPFSIKIDHPMGNWTLSWEELAAAAGMMRVLGSGASVQAFIREELSFFEEGHAFKFLVGEGTKKADIVVAQANHQALNVQFTKAAYLENHSIGGLMGTPAHNQEIEKAAEECLNTIFGMSTWVDSSDADWANSEAHHMTMTATW